MFFYEILYSKLPSGKNIIRLICLGQAKKSQKILLSDYGYAAITFLSESPIEYVYSKYFESSVKELRKKSHENKAFYDPALIDFNNAIYLASKGSYTYITAVDPDYVVPYLSSGRIINKEELSEFSNNFPCGKYITPKKLLEKYDVKLLF